MRRAIAIVAAGFPGSATALGELAEATGLVHCVPLRGVDARSAEARFVHALLRTRQTGLLIVGGWSRAYEPFVDAAAAQRIPVAVYWNSTAGQTGMSVEVEHLTACLADRRVDHRWFVQRDLAAALGTPDRRCEWMPNVIALPAARASAATRRPASFSTTRPARVALFCSPHEYSRKNVLTALVALSRVRRPAVVHVNGLSSDARYRPWLDRLRLRWVDHGWMSRDAYVDTVASLDLGLQVSFAESFNYVAADHLLAGVPVLVSPMVPSVAGLTPGLARPFVVPTADDPGVLTAAIDRVLAQPVRARRQAAALRVDLIAAQRTALARARRVLRAAIGGPLS